MKDLTHYFKQPEQVQASSTSESSSAAPVSLTTEASTAESLRQENDSTSGVAKDERKRRKRGKRKPVVDVEADGSDKDDVNQSKKNVEEPLKKRKYRKKLKKQLSLDKSGEDFETADNSQKSVRSNKKQKDLTRFVNISPCASSKKEQMSPKKASDTEEIVEVDLTSPHGTEKSKPINAFQFMMQSRNKSIGSNSPGKEPPENDVALDDKKETLRARRSVFQSWSDEKGGLKRKRLEEHVDVCITQKLDKRAKRLKKLLGNFEDGKRKSRARILSDSDDSNDIVEISAEKVSRGKKCSRSRSLDKVTSDKVLSEKSEEMATFLGLFNSSPNKKEKIVSPKTSENESKIIKVKMFTPKSKHKKPLGLKDAEKKFLSTDKNTDNQKTGDRDFKKHETSTSSCIIDIDNDEKTPKPVKKKKCTETNLRRSERIKNDSKKSWKMRVKLVEDEDTQPTNVSSITISSESDLEMKQTSVDKPKVKKNGKLAPVFLLSTPKPKVDAAVLEARKNFLLSTIPDCLKRVVERQQTCENADYNVFPKISHVQQKPETPSTCVDFWNLPSVHFKTTTDTCTTQTDTRLQLGDLTNTKNPEQEPKHTQNATNPQAKHFRGILKQIKDSFPEYPVYRIFKLLKDKHEGCKPQPVEPATGNNRKKRKPKRDKGFETADLPKENQNDSLVWTEKYKASSSNDIVGNTSAVNELKKWVNSWLDYQTSAKRRVRTYSSESEFETDNSTESSCGPCNGLILSGPNGCGKTMAVYAVCNELGVNVLELNASSKRTGKRLLQELQEATQSHQVKENDSKKTLNAFLRKPTLKPVPTTACKQISLLLVEDVDVVFEQDDGFVSALSQLLSTSKRPVVLTTTDVGSVHVRRFVDQYRTVRFRKLTPRVSATWLQIVCLLEGLYVRRDALGELLSVNEGDIRRTVLQVQFWAQTGGRPVKNACSGGKRLSGGEEHGFGEDEGSNLVPELGEEFVGDEHGNCVRSFGHNSGDLVCRWWNLPETVQDEGFLSAFERFALGDVLLSGHIGKFQTVLGLGVTNFKVFDSLELRENLCGFSETEEVLKEIGSYIMNHSTSSETELRLHPSSERLRWCTQRQNCDNVLMEVVPCCGRLDKKALALDYLPSLRSIAKSEGERGKNTHKRNNRFYNYLQGLGVKCNDATLSVANKIFMIETM